MLPRSYPRYRPCTAVSFRFLLSDEKGRGDFIRVSGLYGRRKGTRKTLFHHPVSGFAPPVGTICRVDGTPDGRFYLLKGFELWRILETHAETLRYLINQYLIGLGVRQWQVDRIFFELLRHSGSAWLRYRPGGNRLVSAAFASGELCRDSTISTHTISKQYFRCNRVVFCLYPSTGRGTVSVAGGDAEDTETRRLLHYHDPWKDSSPYDPYP